jgi:hypothetical protein
MAVKITILWDVTPCSPVGRYQCFGGNNRISYSTLEMEAAGSSETLISII